MKYCVQLPEYWSRINTKETPFLPSGGSGATINQKENIAYLYGGNNNKDRNNRLIEWNLNTNKFSIIDTLEIEDRLIHRMFYIKENKIIIVGGSYVNRSIPQDFLDLYIYDLNKKVIEQIEIKIKFRAQFSATVDYQNSKLFIYNGFNCNDFYSIDLNSYIVENIELNQNYSKAGMCMEYLPNNKIFIFSGFSRIENKSVCLNNILLFDTNTKKNEIIELSEPFGRTFSKSCIIKKLNKVLIFGGSNNGMESSGSLYFYDYIKNEFNRAYIEPLPGERVEPAMIYSEELNKIYIISGLKPNEENYDIYEEILVLDMNKMGEKTWLGHP